MRAWPSRPSLKAGGVGIRPSNRSVPCSRSAGTENSSSRVILRVLPSTVNERRLGTAGEAERLPDEVGRLVLDVEVDADQHLGEQPEQQQLEADQREEDRDLEQ